MAIIDNRVTEDGDVLIIKPEIPIVGLLGLDNFVNTTVGESETDYFLKEFRYSVDGGLTFSEWLELNLVNIQAASITAYNQFVIEYKYTRVGSAPEVSLEFNDILVSGEVATLPYPVYQKTFFNRFFNVNDINVFCWSLNVLEKLYTKGLILPDYIERGDNNSNLEDEDFIVYWGAITHYFAIIVYMARQFEDVQGNQELLVSFLSSRGIYYSESLDVTELNSIFVDWIEQYKQRGTINVYSKTSSPKGEMIRLLNISDTDEFIFTNLNNFETGWCVGKSSPMWKKTDFSVNLKKRLNDGTFDGYPLVLSEFISETTDEGVAVLEIDSTDYSGIGFSLVTDNYYLVSEYCAYEISFMIKFLDPSAVLKCSVKVLDENNNPINTEKSINGDISSDFITAFSSSNSDFYHYVRLVVFEKGHDIRIGNVNSLGGTNLMFTTGAKKLIPNILVDGNVYIKDIEVKPYQYEFSQGQLGVRTVSELITVNNSRYEDRIVDDIISNNFLPYDNFLKSKYL